MLKEFSDKYNENYNNPQKKELIQKKREVVYRYIESVRSLLKEYENTENRELLITAVQLQVEKLVPETENLRRLMSEHMEMTTDKEYIKHYLFKNEVALSKNDFTFGEPQRVIHFRMN
jgi:rRNA pseudouridine-1189 N-methylase Emg1 (Nep1/Mra1 family)